jgi:hypothetical protein
MSKSFAGTRFIDWSINQLLSESCSFFISLFSTVINRVLVNVSFESNVSKVPSSDFSCRRGKIHVVSFLGKAGWADPADLIKFYEDEESLRDLDRASKKALGRNPEQILQAALTEARRMGQIWDSQKDGGPAEEGGPEGGNKWRRLARNGGERKRADDGDHTPPQAPKRKRKKAKEGETLAGGVLTTEQRERKRKGKDKVGVTWDEEIDMDEVEGPALERRQKRVKRTPRRESAKKGPVREEGGGPGGKNRDADVRNTEPDAVLGRRQALSAATAEESSDEDVDLDWPLEGEENGAQCVASSDEEDAFGQGRIITRGRKRRRCAVLSDEEGDGGPAEASELGALQENFFPNSAPSSPAVKGMGGQTGPSEGVPGSGTGDELPEDARDSGRSSPEAVHSDLGDFHGAGADGLGGAAKPPGVGGELPGVGSGQSGVRFGHPTVRSELPADRCERPTERSEPPAVGDELPGGIKEVSPVAPLIPPAPQRFASNLGGQADLLGDHSLGSHREGDPSVRPSGRAAEPFAPMSPPPQVRSPTGKRKRPEQPGRGESRGLPEASGLQREELPNHSSLPSLRGQAAGLDAPLAGSVPTPPIGETRDDEIEGRVDVAQGQQGLTDEEKRRELRARLQECDVPEASIQHLLDAGFTIFHLENGLLARQELRQLVVDGLLPESDFKIGTLMLLDLATKRYKKA